MSNALEGEPQGLAVISELRAAITRLEESDTRKIARIAEQSARIAELEAALGVRTVNRSTRSTCRRRRASGSPSRTLHICPLFILFIAVLNFSVALPQTAAERNGLAPTLEQHQQHSSQRTG